MKATVRIRFADSNDFDRDVLRDQLVSLLQEYADRGAKVAYDLDGRWENVRDRGEAENAGFRVGKESGYVDDSAYVGG